MDKLTEIKEYAEKQNKTNYKYHGDIEYITYLLQLVETQSKALEFYRDEENYEVKYEDEDDPFSLMPERVLIDGGERARRALSHIETINS